MIVETLEKTNSEKCDIAITTATETEHYNIPENGNLTFWTTYCTHVQSDEVNDVVYCEVNQEKAYPIIVELTMKFLQEGESEISDPYNNHFIFRFVNILQETINTIFRITDVTHYQVFAQDYDYYTVHDMYKKTEQDEFRYYYLKFQFINISVNREYLSMIKQLLIKNLNSSKIINNLDVRPLVANFEEMVTIIGEKSKCIPLFGSSETWTKLLIDPNNLYIIPKVNVDDDSEVCDAIIPISDAFIPSNHEDVNSGQINENSVALTSYWLPLFLSIKYQRDLLLPRYDNIEASENAIGVKRKAPKDDNDTKVLLAMLSPERIKDRRMWSEVAKAIYSSYPEKGIGLQLLQKWTKESMTKLNHTPTFLNSDNGVEVEIESLYYSYHSDNHFTSKTIAWYAKEDNVKKYKEWHDEKSYIAIEKSLQTINDLEIANAFFTLYRLEFAYVPKKTKGSWYHFDHVWKESPEASEIKDYLTTKFLDVYERYKILICNNKNQEEGQVGTLSAKLDNISKVINYLKNSCKHKGIIEMLKILFRNKELHNLLDCNQNLFVFANGVIELNDEDFTFRKTKPEDYVSYFTRIRYNPLFHNNHVLVREVDSWLRKVFMDDEVLNHFLKFSASIFRGKNRDKIFPIFTGEKGNNSKSTIMLAFEYIFGDYMIKLPVTFLLNRRGNSNAATPEMARTFNKRLVVCDEPDPKLKLQQDIVKVIVGNDSQYYRFLYDDGRDVKPTAKYILIANRPPGVNDPDNAMVNRIQLFPFLSTFSNNHPESIEEQYQKRIFKIDTKFENKVPVLAPALAWRILQNYSKYCLEGLIQPKLISETTKEYWETNDQYSIFINDKIIITQNEENKISVASLFEVFTDWYRTLFPNRRPPEFIDVKSSFVSKWGKPKDSKWSGVTFKVE